MGKSSQYAIAKQPIKNLKNQVVDDILELLSAVEGFPLTTTHIKDEPGNIE